MPSINIKLKEWYHKQPRIIKGTVVLSGLVVGTVTGILAAPLVGATASIAGLGVAGGTLSGAAATSAGLAALGGGSIATGGLGMVGGTAVVAGTSSLISGSVAYNLSKKIDNNGKRTSEAVNNSKHEEVNEGDIKFNEEII
ncbi:MAG: hypothetical protein H7A24_16580 [Leptospiraceae bacterium]|nr:hypothetical protein [Leptospiraceae bacterium]